MYRLRSLPSDRAKRCYTSQRKDEHRVKLPSVSYGTSPSRPLSPLSPLSISQTTAVTPEKAEDYFNTKSGSHAAVADSHCISGRERLILWRSNDYFLAIIAGVCLLTEIGCYVLYTPLMPFRLEALGYMNVERLTGYITSACAGGLLVASPIVGYVGQHLVHNKRYLLLTYLSLLAGATVLFMFVVNFSGMLVARVFQGFAAAGIWTSGIALLSDNVAPSRAGVLTSLAMLGYSIGNTTSQTIGGSLYVRLGWKAPSLYALGLIMFGMLLCLCVLEKRELPLALSMPANDTMDNAKEQATSVRRISTKVAMKTLFCNSRYSSGLLFYAWYGAFNSAVLQTCLTLRLAQRYSLDAQQVGLVYLAVAAPGFVFIPVVGFLVDRFGPRKCTCVCAGTFIVWLGLLCIDQLPYAAFVALLVCIGFSVALVNTPVIVYLAAVDKEHGDLVGTSLMYSCWNIAFSLSALIFPIIAGTIMDALGVYRGWVVVCSIVAGLGCVTLAVCVRCMRLSGEQVTGTAAGPSSKASHDGNDEEKA